MQEQKKTASSSQRRSQSDNHQSQARPSVPSIADSSSSDLYLLEFTETSVATPSLHSEALHVIPSMPDRSCTFASNLIALLDKRQQDGRRYLLSSKDRDVMEDDLNVDFTETLLLEQQETDGDPLLTSHLVAANHLLDEFFLVAKAIKTSSSYMRETTLDIVQDTLESFLYPRLYNLFFDMETLTTARDVASAISFMEHFCDSITTCLLDVQVNQPWRQDQETLLSRFLALAVEKEMKELLDRCFELQTPQEIVEDHRNGHLITSVPEQVAYLYRQQVEVAIHRLPARYLEQVVAACNQQLSTCVGDLQLKIGSSWKNISSSLFCAMINDAARLAEQCEVRNEEYLAENDELLEQGANTVTDLLELSLLATSYLSERIMYDLCEPTRPILTTVGDKVWEVDSKCIAVERTIATLKDFYADLKLWLVSDYYFTKVLKQTFDLTIQIYLESFFGNTLINGVQDAAAASEEMRQDHLRLTIFFNGSNFEQYHENTKNGFYSQRKVNSELLILLNISNILAPSHDPDTLSHDIIAVVRRFPEKDGGQAAVLHLAGLRKRYRAAEGFGWIKAIASAQKQISAEQENERCESSRAMTQVLPDLRNSRFIQNVKTMPKGAISRQLSEGTAPYASTTMQLLEVRRRTLISPSSAFVSTISETVKTMDGSRWRAFVGEGESIPKV